MRTITRIAVAGACTAGLLLAPLAAHAATPSAADPAGLPQESALSVLNVLTNTTPAGSHTYFISPSGDDAGPGTKDAPFKTLLRAQAAASAGDVVYIRGGRYDSFTVPETDNPFENVYHYVIPISKSGITYRAYPGDPRPVFDFSGVPTDQRVAAFYIQTNVTDVNFVGFDVTGVKVGAQKQSEAFRIAGGANFVDMAAYGNEANGFYFTIDGTGVVLNSDSHDNIGPTATAAGNTDGFGAHAKNVWFIGDRSWHNSDDGYDSINSGGRVAYIDDWSFHQHGNQDGIGDQNGFKVGGFAYKTSGLPDPLPLHTVVDSLAADNGANDFYANHQPGQSAYWIGNTGYQAGYGAAFNMLERVSPTSPDNIAGYREVLHDNLAFAGTLTANDDTPAANETNNSWTLNGGLALAASDFESTDMQQLTAPRKSDGSLPDVDFLKPVDGSAAQQAGLGYLADKGDVTATLQKLVGAYAQSGDIDEQDIADSLVAKLQAHQLGAFADELAAQSGKHVSDYAAVTLTLVMNALTA
ncbi:right-handed parallel beta-helix repeat-containing protein [Microbacterium sp. 22242]|uniref:right-handed parallel beta-helix repeat-containing protein n=1 Tax=Microbacterium sp. 22242 TaxID=3453896 RepID=UPI003F85E8D0